MLRNFIRLNTDNTISYKWKIKMRDCGFPSAHVHNKKVIIERTYRIMLR